MLNLEPSENTTRMILLLIWLTLYRKETIAKPLCFKQDEKHELLT